MSYLGQDSENVICDLAIADDVYHK
jgi:hypothetical protein